ncbi:formate-dependent phosphoribosylglycinamide formyltransferase [Mycolicibacterium komossense]|uniref:Formate-dependent phosphoribosylglycinamide formyltransferase n=1 Tax=Mycolicibacterium komossense TaxID=1779 RepID=A0ABT3CKY2_9MYCO|nr:formate-dependent phosphoribosylglycinamide formyltransferase [Mycolicibacterium komossense]
MTDEETTESVHEPASFVTSDEVTSDEAGIEAESADADADADVAEPGPEPGPAEPPRPAPRVMLLGAGELGRELVVAFQRLGAEVIAVDEYVDAPAHSLADETAVAQLTDPDELSALIARLRPDYVVPATDAIAADVLATAADRGLTEVVPSARSVLLTLDREGLRRLAADELGLPTAPFWFAGSVDELTAITEHAGFPLVVKPLVGLPGEGQSVLLRPDDVEPAWQRAVSVAGRITHNRVMVETVVEIDYEVTLLTVRTKDTKGLHFCEPIGHRRVEGFDGEVVLESWQPQQMSEAAVDAARSIAARIVNALGGRGVFGVELLVRGDEVYFSDISGHPHDSGLVTLRSQRLSEFELHARAILGLPVDTIMISPGAAEVVFGAAGAAQGERGLTEALAEALRVAESDVRVFPAHAAPAAFSKPRRRLGLALATAPDVIRARDRVRQASTALRKVWHVGKST